MQAIFHDRNKLLVTQMSVTVKIKELEDSMHQVVIETLTSTHQHSTLEFAWNIIT